LLERGTIVAGYRIDGVLGDGGMGVVYRATQLSLDREVALKLLSSDLGDDSGFRIRFQREGQLQAALDNDHIVPVYEAGQSEHGLFLAMRLIDGPTLKDLILGGELDPRRILRLLAQVAHALDAAHAAGLIHRDIKPQNILIGRGDHAYLADFGLIKAPDEAARLTGTGQFIGTIDYVAPEQIQGDPASAASDIYSLAGVLYECLTGEVPYPRPNEAATLHSHVIAPPPRVTERRPELPGGIDDVIARGMAKDPAGRPPSATELIMAASRALASASGLGSSPGGAGAPGGPASAQTTVVRHRPSAVSRSASTPALERASDGVGTASPPPSVQPPPAQEPAEPVGAPEGPAEAVGASEAPAKPAEAVGASEAPAKPAEAPDASADPIEAPKAQEPAEPDDDWLLAPTIVPERASAPAGAAEPASPAEPEAFPQEDESDAFPEEDEEAASPATYPRPAPAPVPEAEVGPAPAPARERARSPLGALVLVALIAAAAIAGYLIGHTRPRSRVAALTNSAAVNHLELRYPSGWELSATPTVVPGMSFDAPLVLTRPRQGRLSAGTVAAAAGPTLLSRSFRARVSGALPRPQPVRLGAVQAYRYTGVGVRGLSGTLSVYVAPTSAGVATIVCSDPSGGDRAFQTECARIASTLRLIGVRPYPLGPSPDDASLLSATFGRLRASSRGPLAALAGAKTASAQASASQQLAGIYDAAAGQLSGATLSPMVRDAQGAVVAALHRCAGAYRSAAAAAEGAAAIPDINATSLNTARAKAEAAYGRAAGAVTAASGALSQALRGLSSLGYTLVGQR
jgi:hypothetical protein